MQLVRKSLILLAGEGAARFLGVLTFALLARAVSIEDFGTLSFAMSAALMLAVIIDMGQNSHLSRVTARSPDSASSLLTRVLMNKAVLGGFSVVGAAALLALWGFAAAEVRLVMMMGVWATFLSMLDSMRAAVRALGLMSLDSAVNGLESLGRLFVVLLIWRHSGSIHDYAAGFIAEAVVACTVFSGLLSRRVGVRLEPRKGFEVSSVLSESWTLGIMGIAIAGFYRIDQVIVQRIAGAAENGLYGAAARVAFTATVGAALVVMAGYPELAKASTSDREYAYVLRRILMLSTGVGAAASLLVAGIAMPLTRLLYGSDFAGAAGLLKVLALMVVANSVTLVGMYSASALGRERRAVILATTMILASVVANVVVVSNHGAFGAAWVSALGEVALAGGMLWISRDRLSRGRTTSESGDTSVDR